MNNKLLCVYPAFKKRWVPAFSRVCLANQHTLTSRVVPIAQFRPCSELGANLVPIKGIPGTKIVLSSCV